MTTTEANQVAELTFVAKANHADPFNDVELDVAFTTPSGKELRVPAFWAGGEKWRVRYASPQVGEHKFKTICSIADEGLANATGVVTITPYTGDNPLYRHGPIRVDASKRFFEHVDGRPFFWLGDTWWMGLTKRLHWPAEVKKLANDRRKKGFTVIQIVAGLYPDMPAFDERGANETGFPWEKEYARIRPEYFDAADERINYLVERGLMPCIVSTWGFHLPWLGVEKMKKHQRYVYARWGALPMVWCVSGELTLPFYTNPGFPAGGEKQIAEWEPVLRYCRSINAFDRPVTAHPSLPFPMSMRSAWKDQTLLDFDMLQTPHGQMDAVAPTIATVRTSYEAKPIMPVVNAEPSYEMLMDKTPPEVARAVFWQSWLNGTGGYTYGANGIWQVNRREQRYGKSPTGGDYGAIPWDEAMHLPGGKQVALAGKFLQRFAWNKIEPHAEWASLEAAPSNAKIAWGDWIWFPEGEPKTDAPVASRWFRKTFQIPDGTTVERAILGISADDRFTAHVNGREIGVGRGHTTPRRFDIVQYLRPGANAIAIEAANMAADVPANPAGLITGGEIVCRNGTKISLASSAEWKASNDAKPKWIHIGYADEKWPAAKVLAKHGEQPWGSMDPGSPVVIPVAAAGIPGQLRIIYVPQQVPLRVKNLEANVEWQAERFDPVSGVSVDLPMPPIDADGSCLFAAPPTWQDWVLVLQRPRP